MDFLLYFYYVVLSYGDNFLRMSEKIRDAWGKNLEINTEVVNGVCPYCEQEVILVSLFSQHYRCVSCGGNIKQKINGYISYIPISSSNSHRIDLARVNGPEKA